jgi:hypothetical protein
MEMSGSSQIRISSSCPEFKLTSDTLLIRWLPRMRTCRPRHVDLCKGLHKHRRAMRTCPYWARPFVCSFLNGDYAAMRVIGVDAPVHLSTTHARITLLDTTADVDARAESGIIDFSGDRGHVCLAADWEINLNFASQQFDGSLDAKAAQPIRVLLPSGFASAFEVIVRRKSDFVCRADICD